MNNYPEFLNYLNKKEKIGIKFGLDNINYLLERLDFPHKKLHYIHIAGTNGKGSVAAMLSSILNRAGIKVGLYTSPHLVDVRERIRINERDITSEELFEIAKKVIPLSQPETTYFELLTAIAIEYFYEKGVEIAIMEVGMGGRLDATNVCYGEIAIITDISLEHTQYLGNTIEGIRMEKMAIVKPGSVVITAESLDSKYPNFKLNILGVHQLRNCALALKAIDTLRGKGYKIPEESIRKGLANVRWPGRFQIFNKDPLIVLDGAHNPGAALVLRKAVEKYLGTQVVLIIGILKDKDYKTILDILIPIAKRIITVTPSSERALSGEVLKEYVKDKPVEYIPNVIDALHSVNNDSPILITGSLYLIGEVLSEVAPHSSQI